MTNITYGCTYQLYYYCYYVNIVMIGRRGISILYVILSLFFYSYLDSTILIQVSLKVRK